MRRIILAASAALAIGGCSAGGGKGEAADANASATAAARPSDAESEAYMRKAEDDWASLAVTRDPELLGRILADDYSGVSSSGTVRDKTAQIADENASPKGQYASARVNYVHYRHYGDTVIAQGAESLKRSDGGPDRNLIWTDIWMFRDGKWQIVASQDSVLPPQAK